MRLLRHAASFAVLAASAVAGTARAAPVLMPTPSAMAVGEGGLAMAGPFRVNEDGCPGPFAARAVARFQADVSRQAGFPAGQVDGPSLSLRCGSDPDYLTLKAKEAYRLDVTPSGVAIAADGPAALLHALATLRQLVGVGGGAPILPPVHIDDAPRFAWRGVMIDVARHFMTIPTLKRQVDAMERVKLNVLHLHLSDNESFRVESRRYPRLQQVAAHGQFYSQAEIRDLVSYAAERGVRIVPEFDVPAHTAAIVAAYPELGATPDPTDRFAMINPAINPASEASYRFIAGLFTEMAALFPDHDFHIGGDEVGDPAWRRDPTVQAFMRAHRLATKAEMEAYFHQRVIEILRKSGKTAIGWDEIADQPTPDDVIVQAWRNSNHTGAAAASGHRVIVSAGYYLDNLEPAARAYAVDPLDLQAYGFGADEMARITRASPLAAAAAKGLALAPMPPLTPVEQQRVLGGEMALWSELVDDEMLDARLWPRAAALAERFWSPATVRNAAELERRLPVVQSELEISGLEAQANRARMAARLAPDAPQTVLILLDAVAPVRNAAHNRAIPAYLRGDLHPPPQRLVELADMAPVDSVPALQFDAAAERLATGDLTELAAVRAQLELWRSNHARFVQAAMGRPLLEAALPTSAQLSELADVGLAALAAIERKGSLPAAELQRADAALAHAAALEAASSRPIFALMLPRPPADLIIAITPGLRRLVEAARPQAGSQPTSPKSSPTPSQGDHHVSAH